MYKFKWVVIIGLLLMGLHGNAQTFSAAGVVGFNMAQLDGDDLGGYNRIGLATGGRVDALLNERWKLSFELLFSQMGSDASKYETPISYDNIRLNYVEVPVSLIFREWKTDEDDGGDFYRIEVAGGGAFGRLINFKSIDAGGADITDIVDYESNLFMAHIGATWYFTEHLGLHVHWARAISDTDNSQDNLYSRLINIKGVYVF